MPSLLRNSRLDSLDPHTCPAELLFRRCQRDADPVARETLVLRFLPLARKLARRYVPSSVPYEDLVQVASLALIKAIDRFDYERGTPFPAFAIPTILGELKRHFRDSSWSVHVAREAKERARAVQDASEQLIACHGRAPTVHQLALYLELSEEQVLDGLQTGQAYATVSLDAPSPSANEEDDATLASGLGAEDEGYDLVDTEMAVCGALSALPQQEQNLLRMRFIEEMTQSEIGGELGISQMQVSRLLSRTLERLRTPLEAAYGEATTR
jgi:RNA polymerase sigma-B factor